MAARKRPVVSVSHYVREEEWSGLVKGDLVRVTGMVGEYTFTGFCRHENGLEHVEVYGPRPIRRNSRAPGFHAVTEDRVRIPSRKALATQRAARTKHDKEKETEDE